MYTSHVMWSGVCSCGLKCYFICKILTSSFIRYTTEINVSLIILLLYFNYIIAYYTSNGIFSNMNSKDTIILIFIAGLFVCTRSQVRIGQCTKIDSCSCVYDDGTIVNLRPLERTDGLPQ